MSLLPLLLSALLASAAAMPGSGPSRLCEGAFSAGGEFDRFTLSGTARCQCVSEGAARCPPLREYPTVAPGSPSAQLALYHQPFSGNDQQLLQLQLNVECAFNRSQGRHCLLTEGATGSGLPVCDCAV